MVGTHKSFRWLYSVFVPMGQSGLSALPMTVSSSNSTFRGTSARTEYSKQSVSWAESSISVTEVNQSTRKLEQWLSWGPVRHFTFHFPSPMQIHKWSPSGGSLKWWEPTEWQKACGARERSSKLGVRCVEARKPMVAFPQKLPHTLKCYDRISAM